MTDEVERLVRIETKLDALAPIIADHEKRLRALETWKAWMIGAAAAAGAAGHKLATFFPI